MILIRSSVSGCNARWGSPFSGGSRGTWGRVRSGCRLMRSSGCTVAPLRQRRRIGPNMSLVPHHLGTSATTLVGGEPLTDMISTALLQSPIDMYTIVYSVTRETGKTTLIVFDWYSAACHFGDPGTARHVGVSAQSAIGPGGGPLMSTPSRFASTWPRDNICGHVGRLNTQSAELH